MILYKATNKIWKAAFNDDAIWELMCDSWNIWVRNNNYGTHWQKKKRSTDSMNDNMNNEDMELLNNRNVEVLLSEDKDFDHDRGQSGMRSQIMDSNLEGDREDDESLGWKREL